MTTAQVVDSSVTVNNNSPIRDYVQPDDQTQHFEMTPGFKPFTRKYDIDLPPTGWHLIPPPPPPPPKIVLSKQTCTSVQNRFDEIYDTKIAWKWDS